MTLLFVATTIICAVGWFKNCVAAKAMVKYFCDKNYTLPSDEEMAACTRWAVKKTLGIK